MIRSQCLILLLGYFCRANYLGTRFLFCLNRVSHLHLRTFPIRIAQKTICGLDNLWHGTGFNVRHITFGIYYKCFGESLKKQISILMLDHILANDYTLIVCLSLTLRCSLVFISTFHIYIFLNSNLLHSQRNTKSWNEIEWNKSENNNHARGAMRVLRISVSLCTMRSLNCCCCLVIVLLHSIHQK